MASGLHNNHSQPQVGLTVRQSAPGGHHLVGRPSNNRTTPENFAQRFWRKVEQRGPDDCWPWLGVKNYAGRGQVYLPIPLDVLGGAKKRAYAPGVAWELTSGQKIPAGHVCAHRCDNPTCCNPNHLFVATQRENIRDAMKKGRHGGWRHTGLRVNGQPSKRRGVKAPNIEQVPSVEKVIYDLPNWLPEPPAPQSQAS